MSSNLSSEPDYQSSSFFDVNIGTDNYILGKINDGKIEIANKIRHKLHQDILKDGFKIDLSENDIHYSEKILNVISKMLDIQGCILRFSRNEGHCIFISYKNKEEGITKEK